MIRATAARRVRRCLALRVPFFGAARAPGSSSGSGTVAATAPAAPARPAPARKRLRVYPPPLSISVTCRHGDEPVDVVREAPAHLIPRHPDPARAEDLHPEVLRRHVPAVSGARALRMGGHPHGAPGAEPSPACEADRADEDVVLLVPAAAAVAAVPPG